MEGAKTKCEKSRVCGKRPNKEVARTRDERDSGMAYSTGSPSGGGWGVYFRW